jgi:hypothetical protein
MNDPSNAEDDDRRRLHPKTDSAADRAEIDPDESGDDYDAWPPDDLDLELDDEPEPEPGDFWMEADDEDF